MENQFLSGSAITHANEDIRIHKNKIGNKRIRAESAYRILKDQLIPEGNARQNLATFCQTYMEPEAQKIISETLDRNAIDKSLYLQTADIEDRCVEIIADLWHRPNSNRQDTDKVKPKGTSTIGSSEACMLGGLAMKKRWENWAKNNGVDMNKKPNLIITSAYQVCWEKFAAYWDVDLKLIPVDESHLTLNTNKLRRAINEYTIGVVAVLGLTYTGLYDNIAKINGIVDKYNDKKKNKVYIHVDAASGGLFEPFVNPDFEWDFRIKNVVSINASGHKYGLVYPGVGWIIWKSDEFIPDEMVFEVSYLGGTVGTVGINFSKSAGQIIGQYYNFIRLGREGYTDIHKMTFDISVFITQEISKIRVNRKGKEVPVFKVINDKNVHDNDIDYTRPDYVEITAAEIEERARRRRGVTEHAVVNKSPDVTRQPRLPMVCWRLSTELSKGGWNLNDFADRMLMRGWQIPVYPLSADLTEVFVQRIVCRADMSVELAEILVDDIKNSIRHLEENYSSASMNKKAVNHRRKHYTFGFRH